MLLLVSSAIIVSAFGPSLPLGATILTTIGWERGREEGERRGERRRREEEDHVLD